MHDFLNVFVQDKVAVVHIFSFGVHQQNLFHDIDQFTLATGCNQMVLANNPSDEGEGRRSLTQSLSELVTMCQRQTVQDQSPNPELNITRTRRMLNGPSRIKNTIGQCGDPQFGESFVNTTPVFKDAAFIALCLIQSTEDRVQTK